MHTTQSTTLRHSDMEDPISLSTINKSDSYTNLYDQDMPLGGSAHSLRNQLAAAGAAGILTSASLLQQPQSPHQQTARGGLSPRFARHAAAGQTATTTGRLGLPETSSPPPPPYKYKPASPVIASLHHDPGSSGQQIETVLASDERYPPPTTTTPGYAGGGRSGMPPYGSPTFPPSTNESIPDVLNIPGAVRRPMSFVKALEMSDQLASAGAGLSSRQRTPQFSPSTRLQHETIDEDDPSAFGSSYEIAV